MSEIEDESPIMKGSEADKAADFANYFCSYGFLYHQKQMLMGTLTYNCYTIHCNTYYLIMSNKIHDF